VPKHPAQPAAGLAARPPVVRDPTRATTVLIVEDDGVTRLLIEEMLRAEGGARIQIACDGRMAISLMAEAPPDLVLLDLSLPDMDGFAILRWMRARPATAQVPVVALTANETTVTHALACGCAGVVRKPPELTSVIQVVRSQFGAALA
jgi:CheY-like chemotaxis protein